MGTESGQVPLPILGYGSRERRCNARRWVLPTFIVALGLVAGARTAYLLKEPVVRIRNQYEKNAQRKALFAQCSSHIYPANTLVFDESIDANGVQMYVDGSWQPLARPSARPFGASDWHTCQMARYGKWPSPRNRELLSQWYSLIWFEERFWALHVRCAPGLRQGKYYTMSPLNADEVFVHGRRAKGGQWRLVAVGFDPVAFALGSDTPFRVSSARYTTPLSRLKMRAARVGEEFHFAVPTDQPLKLYAGHPNPDDESHFTIAYETPTGRGTIDGWLLPDGTVSLQVRDGPAKCKSIVVFAESRAGIQ